jgi:serine/threonine-protein kinase RsbW
VSGLLHLRLEAVAASVPLARAAITEVCARLGLEADLTERVRLAVTEACTNAVRHAYQDAQEGSQKGNLYSLEAVEERGALLVIVRDTGVGIPPSAADATRNSSLGLGLKLIARMTTSSEIAALPDRGTRVAMRFSTT